MSLLCSKFTIFEITISEERVDCHNFIADALIFTEESFVVAWQYCMHYTFLLFIFNCTHYYIGLFLSKFIHNLFKLIKIKILIHIYKKTFEIFIVKKVFIFTLLPFKNINTFMYTFKSYLMIDYLVSWYTFNLLHLIFLIWLSNLS